MNGIDALLDGYRAFRQNRYVHQRALFNRLAQGQSPSVMIIACADSRADPSMIFSAAPGELFVVRNVANLVPPYEEEGRFHGTAAALEFAIEGLKVDHIVVMGHASCGGINACIGAAEGRPVGQFIGPWVSLLDPLRDRLRMANSNLSGEKLQLRMEQAAIGQSLANIESYPFASSAIAKRQLLLHGAWFSIATGELSWRNPESGTFDPVSLSNAA